MNKLALATFFLGLLFIVEVVTPMRAFAQDRNGFDEVVECSGAFVSQITESDRNGSPIIKATGGARLNTRVNYYDICVDTKVIDAAFVPGEEGGNDLYYCDLSEGRVMAIWGDPDRGSGYVDDGATGGNYGACCTEAAPYYYKQNAGDHCCGLQGLEDNKVISTFGDNCGSGVAEAEAANMKEHNNVERPNGIGNGFSWANLSFTCDQGCVVAQDGFVVDSVDGNGNLVTFDETKANTFVCVGQGEDERLVGDQVVKILGDEVCGPGGKTISRNEFENLGVNGVKACGELEDIGEQEACRACFLDNNPGSGSSFVYTAIGCVDTSRDGLVTRIFQIGIGLMGGFSTYKFVKAAILMQKRDPAAMQQAQEEMLSAFFAIITLLAATFILRFIGVDILGILPVAFFN